MTARKPLVCQRMQSSERRSPLKTFRPDVIGAAMALALCAFAVSCAPQAPADSNTTAPAPSFDNAAAQRGLAYARLHCATCHAIAAGQVSSPVLAAPSFDAVANTSGMTRTALNAWLHSPHNTMPGLVVAESDRDDIFAYLESLQRHGGRT
jgi:mono/diheme cytochrome c family protein